MRAPLLVRSRCSDNPTNARVALNLYNTINAHIKDLYEGFNAQCVFFHINRAHPCSKMCKLQQEDYRRT